MQKRSEMLKRRRQTAADFFYGFAFVLLLSLLLVIVVIAVCCQLLLVLHTRTHSGSVALQLQARVTNWTILIFSHSFCCLCRHLCRVTPSCFLICFGSFRKFTVREINTPGREARKLRQIRSCAVISVRCCCCFCCCYFLRNLLFLCENCAAETKALAHFPNKLTRIVNGSRD